MSTFLGALVARAVAGTVLADETFVTVAGVRYRTDATNADTVEQDEEGVRTYRKTIKVPAEDFPVALTSGLLVEYGGASYRTVYALPLEDVWELGLTAYGGAYARP